MTIHGDSLQGSDPMTRAGWPHQPTDEPGRCRPVPPASRPSAAFLIDLAATPADGRSGPQRRRGRLLTITLRRLR